MNNEAMLDNCKDASSEITIEQLEDFVGIMEDAISEKETKEILLQIGDKKIAIPFNEDNYWAIRYALVDIRASMMEQEQSM